MKHLANKLTASVALSLFISGCASAPHGHGESGSEAKRVQAEPLLVEPPENCAKERERGELDHLRPAPRQQHPDDPHQQTVNLHGLYARASTEKIKSIVRRHSELLWDSYGIHDLSLRSAGRIEVGDPAGQRLFDEMIEAKQELMRRWKAGDSSAGLVEFTQ